MEPCVLFVDDEQSVLSAIRRMLMDEPYEQLFAASGEEALRLLNENIVHVIISDMRMPIMDGVAFLEKSRDLQPNAIRIILSGQSDMLSVMQAINRGAIWQYIAKPWNDDDMKLTIRNALDLYRVHADRLRLIDELEQKNNELEQLNNELEERVRRRTRLIEAQKQLLQRMIDGMDLDDFTDSACKTINRLAHDTDVVLYHTIGSKSIVTTGPQVGEQVMKKIEKVFSSRQSDNNDKTIITPIIHSSSVLGCIAFLNVEQPETVFLDEILNSMIPVLSLALNQFNMINDAPNIARSLDDIIDQL